MTSWVMAFSFSSGAPREEPDHPRRAVACALEMQRAMVDLNSEHSRLGLPELRVGIGINTGIAVVGTIGCEKRKKYTAMGGPVNLAFRVQAQAKGGEILVTPSVCQRLQKDIEVDSSREVRLKGIAEPVMLYSVVGIRTG